MVDLEALGMRERILEMATRLFVAQGYAGISMREIAEACGLSKAGLYYHFKDKEDMFLAILSQNLDSLEAIISEAESIGDSGSASTEKISFFVRAIFTRLPAEHRAIIRLASQEMDKISPAARAGFDQRYYDQFIGRIKTILEEGIRAGEFRAMDAELGVWGLLGLMYPFFNQGRPDNDMEPIVQFILMVFLKGVQARD